MLRVICIFIAFLVGAKEVVAFGDDISRSDMKVYSALDYQSHDVWLGECEDSTERTDGDDSDTPLYFYSPAILDTNRHHALAMDSMENNLSGSSDVLQLLFITYRNMRL